MKLEFQRLLWPFRRRWHPEARWYARIRALLLIVRGYETEICGRCGGKVGIVWHAPDELWLKHSGYPTDGGVLCLHCFAFRADAEEPGVYWECSGGGVWPSCSGQPCAHEEAMIIIADQRDYIWKQYQDMCQERDAWWDKYLMATAPKSRQKSSA